MPRSMKVEISPTVFKWLRTSSGYTVEDVAKRLKTSIDSVIAIEVGEKDPSLTQLKDLSNAYKRPLATFFLSEPQEEDPMPKDHRMLPGKEGIFDKRTLYVIRRARGLQEVGSELLINIDSSSRPKLDTMTQSQDPERTGSIHRDRFGLDLNMQKRFSTGYELFNFLRDRIEEMNILVFQFSMPIEDARGFVLTDKNPKVMVINSKDSIEARVFTLMHEFGHVLLEQTAIDLPEFSGNIDHEAEKWCNSFASELLLPKKEAFEIFRSEENCLTETSTLNRLSKRYKVSKGMLCYKMFDLGMITRNEYDEVMDRYRPPAPGHIEEDEEMRGGISADIRCISERGNKFVSLIAENYDRNYITFTDALNYLSVRSKNFDSVLAKARQ